MAKVLVHEWFQRYGSPRRSTVTRVGTLNLSGWWNPCVSSLASRRPYPLHTTPEATHSVTVSDLIAPCIIFCVPCRRTRSQSGHSTSRSLYRCITTRLILPPGFCPLPLVRPGTSGWVLAGPACDCWPASNQNSPRSGYYGTPHSEHRFPAPSSKLSQIWLRQWRGTLYLRAAVHRRGQSPPKGSGTNMTVEAT